MNVSKDGEILSERKRARDGLTDGGAEQPDPKPVAPPLGWKKQPTMVDHIRNLIRSEKLKAEAEAAGAESFEEADNFDTEDDPPDPASPYENEFEPKVPPTPAASFEEAAAAGVTKDPLPSDAAKKPKESVELPSAPPKSTP